MFARVTTYELGDGRVSESIESFEPAIEAVRDLDGFVDAFFFVERDGRHAITITLWENVDTMERGRITASRARTEAAREAGADVMSTYELEVALHAGATPAETALLER
jgi:heme-degrading monooxygenase HmoA